MAIVGAFLGGSPKEMIPAGKAVLTLQWTAQNASDVSGASFAISGPVSKTIQADAGGRAEVMVPAGTYTVTVTHKGEYLGDEPQTAIAESQKAYVVMFNGVVDQTVLFDQKIADMEVRLRAQLQEDIDAGLVSKQDKKWVESTMEADKTGYSEILVKMDFGENSLVGNSTVIPIIGKEQTETLSVSYVTDSVNTTTKDWTIVTCRVQMTTSPTGVITIDPRWGYGLHHLRLWPDGVQRSVSVDVGQWHGYGARATGTIYDSYTNFTYADSSAIPDNLRFRVFVR